MGVVKVHVESSPFGGVGQPPKRTAERKRNRAEGYTQDLADFTVPQALGAESQASAILLGQGSKHRQQSPLSLVTG
jgi:hypothetical protein